MNKFDLIYAGDILEHFTKENGFKFLDLIKSKGKNIIISTPKVVSKQGAVFNNEYETHRSQWMEKDFPNCKINYFKVKYNYSNLEQ